MLLNWTTGLSHPPTIIYEKKKINSDFNSVPINSSLNNLIFKIMIFKQSI
jgi:hypothetical protein